MNKYVRLSFASLFGLGIGLSHANMINDSGEIAIVYITNSSQEAIRMIAFNKENKSNYIHFNCLYPIPKEYQPQFVPSPSFDTVVEDKYVTNQK